MSTLNNLKKTQEEINLIDSNLKSFKELIEISEEEEIYSISKEIEKDVLRVDELKMITLLNDEYDKEDCIFEIHSGAGGTEACDWVLMLSRMYQKYFDNNLFKYEILDYLDGDEAGLKSIIFSVKGEYAYGFLKSENQYVSGILAAEYKSNGKENGKFIYYNGNKKVLSEMEVLQTNKKGQSYQMPKTIKIFGKNGKIEREYTFENGTLENQTQKVYYPNGNLKYTGIAKNNDMINMEIKDLYEEYNSNGAKIMSCKEIETDKWSCEYYKKNGELKIRKQIKKDFSKNLSTSKYIYDSETGVNFLKSVGEGIGNIFLMILEGI